MPAHVSLARSTALLLALCTLSAARLASAFPTSRLVYARGPGAEGCPDQDAVRSAVATRLGYDPFFPSSDKTIVARVSGSGTQLKGVVELVDEHGVELGQREFTAQAGQCAALVHAMALSISIAIDPKSAETYTKGPPDEPAASAAGPAADAPRRDETAILASVPKPPPLVASAASTSAARRDGVDLSVALGALALFNAAPRSTLGALASAAARVNAWSLGVDGYLDLPVTAHFADVRFRTTTFGLDVVPCFHFGVGSACEVTSLGGLTATGLAPDAKSGTSVLFSLGGRLGIELPVSSSLSLLAHADLLANPWPVRLVSAGHTLWQTPALSEELAIAAALHFR